MNGKEKKVFTKKKKAKIENDDTKEEKNSHPLAVGKIVCYNIARYKVEITEKYLGRRDVILFEVKYDKGSNVRVNIRVESLHQNCIYCETRSILKLLYNSGRSTGNETRNRTRTPRRQPRCPKPA